MKRMSTSQWGLTFCGVLIVLALISSPWILLVGLAVLQALIWWTVEDHR